MHRRIAPADNGGRARRPGGGMTTRNVPAAAAYRETEWSQRNNTNMKRPAC